ncbi:C1QL [Mytilus coruscus]|uniref:C1QL n=1 Tax=Mytilus coruscus TaxID=42192 RepID=A0A6J8BUW0_MYTCO|nr:C1QL [Mytilus coruscus]
MENTVVILLLSLIVIMMSFYVYETERKLLNMGEKLLKQKVISNKAERKLLHMEEKLLKQEVISDTAERKLLNMEEILREQEFISNTAGSVEFTASIYKTYHVDPNQILKFETVWVNIGDGYDPESGVFTAPKSGLYMVSNTINAALNGLIRCNLWKNDVQNIGSLGTLHEAGTLNILMMIRKGDRIYIKSDKHGYHAKLFSNHMSTFSAVLIND